MGNDARAAEFMKGRRVMEVNPGHPIILGLKAKVDLESRWVQLGAAGGLLGGCWGEVLARCVKTGPPDGPVRSCLCLPACPQGGQGAGAVAVRGGAACR